MKRTLVVVNGEKYWHGHFPDDGSYVLLESNDVPGLSGFPETVRQEQVDRLREKLG